MNKSTIIIVSILSVIGIILGFVAAFYENDDKNYERKVVTNLLITILAISLFCIVVVIMDALNIKKRLEKILRGSREELESLLAETDQENFLSMCDAIFDKAGKEIKEQYELMRRDRPIKEVINLCGNYAKSLLKKKV